MIFLGNVEVFVGNGVRRGFDLNVAAGAERNFFAFGNGKLEFFNERCFVVVGNDGAFPFFHAEHFFGYFDVHVGFDIDLAGQTAAFACFAFADVGQLGRQNVAAAAFHDNAALSARTAATAGGGDKDALAGKRAQEFAAGGHSQFFFIIDFDGDVAFADQLGFGKQNHQCQS